MSEQNDYSGYTWYVVGMLCAVSIFNYIDRVAFSVLAPLIKQDLSLSDSQIGMLGFAFAIFHAVGAIPIARWADKGIRRNVVALALGAWSLMAALSGAAQTFWQLFLARAGVGVGEAGGSAPAASIICDYVPFRRRASALSIFTLGNGAGALIGMSLAGWLGHTVGWRWAFVALGVPGIAFALLIRISIKEPVRGRFDNPGTAVAPPQGRAVFAFLAKCTTYKFLTLYLVANGFIQGALLHWMPSFYVRTFETELSVIGLALGVASGAGFGIGMLTGGLVCDKINASNVPLGLKIGAAATVIAGMAIVASLLAPSFAVSIVFFFFKTMMLGAANSPVVSHLYNVVPAGMRTTAGATAFMIASLFGFGLGPLLVGAMSDFLSPMFGIQSLQYALLTMSFLTPILALVLLASAKSVSGDLSAVSSHGR